MVLKLKRTPGLYLVGFMAAGKSTVGRALAGALGWSFADIDLEIEKEQGVSISDIFRERGEPAFRDIETETIRRHVDAIRSGTPSVVALGGGAFAQPRNWEILENNGVTIWLDCPFEIVCRRIDGDVIARPLAVDRSRLAQLFESRRSLYSRADFRVEVSTGDIPSIVRHILSLPVF
jgi:shikimate kinase